MQDSRKPTATKSARVKMPKEAPTQKPYRMTRSEISELRQKSVKAIEYLMKQ
ncbi:hypothetical protein BY454_1272 [Marinobacter persicus]|uniref:Uncharacterized protein n=1 Tax=Marinobacter persicus TaxID=930118 RepID=A0A2S6G3W2_9GAMM|nr:MAG: hypothetical protein AWU57_1315 [Marinobacter sp. T13-3]PPK50488.1 hypothetical protein BY455_12548 [Marinobacter persicus]PPK53770.1 hypothetical protein B0H24_102548 [Marinobacter persicus]PPK56959.1 hypothetical protein BY454_1272 [Marinobacter persicus]